MLILLVWFDSTFHALEKKFRFMSLCHKSVKLQIRQQAFFESNYIRFITVIHYE